MGCELLPAACASGGVVVVCLATGRPVIYVYVLPRPIWPQKFDVASAHMATSLMLRLQDGRNVLC